MARSINFIEQYGQLGEINRYVVEDTESRTVKSGKSNKRRLISLSWLINSLRFALLPQGYPSSVSGDYLSYQLWDTLQAFCSYLSGTLTTKAIMQGVGVGDAAATPLAATITWIMRDGTGMIGRIIFASWKGPSLDANCKQWRLAADVLNDIAMAIELCSPMFSATVFPWALCIATSFKSIVGVAGGATRAALTQHQARRNNMADVAAKDGSQETLVNLVASTTGVFLLPLLTSDRIAWILFGALTCVHLFANYKAVRCLNIPILNAQRYNLLLMSYFVSHRKQLDTSKTVNFLESVFLGTGITDKKLCGFQIMLGSSLSDLGNISQAQLKFACETSNDYLVLPNLSKNTISVIFMKNKSPAVLKAYFHAVCLAMKIHNLKKKMSIKDALDVDYDVTEHFTEFQYKAKKQGWLMDRHQLLVDEWRAVWKYEEKPFKYD